MSSLVRPFAALRPEPEHAAAVLAPPYDVVSTEEARALVAGRPNSFLHVSRPEIEFPPGTEADSDAVHARAAENLERLKVLGLLVRDPTPGFYVYRLEMPGHGQTGVALTASVKAYRANRVRKHELTRPSKEDDRVRNMSSLNAQTGPVLSVHRADPSLKTLLSRVTQGPALLEVKGPRGVEHSIWRVADNGTIGEISSAFNAMDAIYIADGHHRSAAAARVASERHAAGASGEESYDYFLTVVFPHDEMKILDYNRVVKDLNGLSTEAILHRLGDDFDVDASERPVKPDGPATFGMFVDGQWYRLVLHGHLMPAGEPVARLDVSLLQDRILTPLLGVGDPRTDPRIDFIGGIRGLEALEHRVRSGEAAIAFSLFPTRMEQLMEVADAGKLMPPKSTWFEPKLADGLLSHVLD